MYLLVIALSLCASYIILRYALPALFERKRIPFGHETIVSLAIIISVSVVGYFVAFSIKDASLSNRFLHGFCGGFVAFMVCFLAARDGALRLTRFQFFAIAALIVTSLGVANELMEFFLQTYAGMMFAPALNDTWLDLVSNTTGILFGGVSFTPFVKNTK